MPKLIEDRNLYIKCSESVNSFTIHDDIFIRGITIINHTRRENDMSNHGMIQISNQYENENMMESQLHRRKTHMKKTSNTFFIGIQDNGILKDNQIEKRRNVARKEAHKIISGAFTKEKAIDQRVSDNIDHVTKLNQENQEYSKQIDKLNADMEDLKTSYGVTDDSREQQDFELLKKRQDYLSDSKVILTDDEKEQLKKIDEEGLTEYQQAGLDNYKFTKNLQNRIEQNNKEIMCANAENKAIRLERLKSNPMVDAGKEAADVLDDANEQIKGMVVSDAKDNIDQKMKEQKDEALEKKEKEQAKKDKIENAKEKKEQTEALTKKRKEDAKNKEEAIDNHQAKDYGADGSSNTVNTQIGDAYNGQVQEDMSDYLAEAQKAVNQMKDQLKLLDDDIKGIEVDSQM